MDIQLVKFIGEVMADPHRFKDHIHFDIERNEVDMISGQFKITGPLVPVMKSLVPNVEKTLA